MSCHKVRWLDGGSRWSLLKQSCMCQTPLARDTLDLSHWMATFVLLAVFTKPHQTVNQISLLSSKCRTVCSFTSVCWALHWLRTPPEGCLDVSSVLWRVLQSIIFLFGVFHSSNRMSPRIGGILCMTDAVWLMVQSKCQLLTLHHLPLPAGSSGSHPSPGRSWQAWSFQLLHILW